MVSFCSPGATSAPAPSQPDDRASDIVVLVLDGCATGSASPSEHAPVRPATSQHATRVMVRIPAATGSRAAADDEEKRSGDQPERAVADHAAKVAFDGVGGELRD